MCLRATTRLRGVAEFDYRRTHGLPGQAPLLRDMKTGPWTLFEARDRVH